MLFNIVSLIYKNQIVVCVAQILLYKTFVKNRGNLNFHGKWQLQGGKQRLNC